MISLGLLPDFRVKFSFDLSMWPPVKDMVLQDDPEIGMMSSLETEE